MAERVDRNQPLEELAEGFGELVEKLRCSPAEFTSPTSMAAALGVSLECLQQCFEHAYHQRPEGYFDRQRVLAARRFLAEGSGSAGSVSRRVGFSTAAELEQRFRRQTRVSTAAFGRLAMPDCADFELDLPAGTALDYAWRHFGRDPQSHSERVQGKQLELALEHGGRVVEVTGQRTAGRLHCRLRARGKLPAGAALAAHQMLLRVLGLEADPAPFERFLKGLPDGHRLLRQPGLTVPQTRDPFDGLIWVIAGQQVSLAVAYVQRRKLTEAFGRRGPGTLRAPPTPERLAELDLADFRRCSFSQRKAEYLSAIARSIVNGELDLEQLGQLPADPLERRLLSIRGLGRWSANYLMMRNWGLADCVPLGDAALRRALQEFYELDGRPDDQRTTELMQFFAPFRSLATFHLWASLEKAT